MSLVARCQRPPGVHSPSRSSATRSPRLCFLRRRLQSHVSRRLKLAYTCCTLDEAADKLLLLYSASYAALQVAFVKHSLLVALPR
jgi:hypothetical protein